MCEYDCAVCGETFDEENLSLCFETARHPDGAEQVGYSCDECWDDPRVRDYNKYEVA